MSYKIKKNELLFLVGLFLLSLINWEYFSKIINFDTEIINFLIIITSLCFLFNVFVSKYTKNELIITGIIAFIFFISAYKTRELYLFINLFAIITSKNIPFSKIIKFFFFKNLFFICIHVALTSLGVVANTNTYYTYLDGTYRQTLNLRHPNYLAATMFWTLASFIYLTKNKSKFMRITVIILWTSLTYVLTYSRTSMILFALLFVYVLFDKNRLFEKSSKLIKLLIVLLCFLEIYLGYNYNSITGSIKELILFVNELLSQRLYLNALALRSFDLTMLGDLLIQFDDANLIIIDSFYISCLIQYGVSILLISLFGFIKYKVKNNKIEFLFLTLVFIAALTERYITFTSLAFPLFFFRELLFKDEVKNLKEVLE